MAEGDGADDPEVGQAVLVTNRLASVRAVEPYDHPKGVGRLHVVDVEYLDDWRYPEAEQLLWEVETAAKVLGKTALPDVDAHRLDALRAFVNAHRWSRLNRLRESDALTGEPILGGVAEDEGQAAESGNQALDIVQVARDQILDYIRRKFSGHRLAALVDAVLRAEGYLTRVSPPGPDGGVDILAGSGPMGFGQPRLCVQVKSSASPADVNVLRSLQGILQNFHAEQGLLVCWGGYKSSALQEARQSFFTIRLWDSGDLLGALLKNHDKFSDDLKAELPLKRVWALVFEE